MINPATVALAIELARSPNLCKEHIYDLQYYTIIQIALQATENDELSVLRWRSNALRLLKKRCPNMISIYEREKPLYLKAE